MTSARLAFQGHAMTALGSLCPTCVWTACNLLFCLRVKGFLASVLPERSLSSARSAAA